MSVFRAAILRLRGAVRGGKVESDVGAELRFHIEMRTLDNIAAGMTPERAREDAVRRFGDFGQVKEMCLSLDESDHMKFLKSCLWMTAACWMAFWALSPKNFGMRAVLFEALAVAILSCLLVGARSVRRTGAHAGTAESFTPPEERFGREGAKTLYLWNVDDAGDVPTHGEGGRTPVERLLRDE